MEPILSTRKTLFSLSESLHTKNPAKYEQRNLDRHTTRQRLFVNTKDTDPQIEKVHEYFESRGRTQSVDEPPLIEIRYQYMDSVTNTRFENSILKNIVDGVDDVFDKVSAEYDEGDYESLIEVGKNSVFRNSISVFRGSMLTQPEVRILVVQLRNIEKLSPSGNKIKNATVKCSVSSGDKKIGKAQSMKGNSDYRNVIPFGHVFRLRGDDIEGWKNNTITITVNAYTEKGKEVSYVTFAPEKCIFGEASHDYSEKHPTNENLWGEFLDDPVCDPIKVVLPLKVHVKDKHKKQKSKKGSKRLGGTAANSIESISEENTDSIH